MNKKADPTLSRTRIIYIVTTLFLIALSFYIYGQIKNLINSSDSVNHSNRVTLSLGKTLIFILDAETNQRGFLLTGDSFLMERKAADLAQMNIELQKLDSLILDNPQQVQNLRVLHLTINGKLANMDSVLKAYRRDPGSPGFKALVNAGIGKMDRLKAMIKLMVGEEKVLLEQRTNRYSQLANITPIFIVVLFLGALIILYFSYHNLNIAFGRSRELRIALADSNKDLMSLNQSYEYAEQVGLFGSYRYNFTAKTLSYSDNLFRLLGCEPGEFEPGGENFLKFVHPEDREFVKDATTAAFSDRKISKWEYRMLKKDGSLIYVRGTGKLISEGAEIRWMVGTLQDITEEKHLEINLKIKNDE